MVGLLVQVRGNPQWYRARPWTQSLSQLFPFHPLSFLPLTVHAWRFLPSRLHAVTACFDLCTHLPLLARSLWRADYVLHDRLIVLCLESVSILTRFWLPGPKRQSILTRFAFLMTDWSFCVLIAAPFSRGSGFHVQNVTVLSRGLRAHVLSHKFAAI